MNKKFSFEIKNKLDGTMARTGVISTPHGDIQTPSFVVVGTKATVKTLTPEQINDLGAQVVLANTYHLYMQPGAEIVRRSGGFPKMMNYSGPTMTDSGGFQVFSLGEAFGTKVSKVASGEELTVTEKQKETKKAHTRLAKIDEDGVTFKSHLDGSSHRFTPESSMEVQWDLGADMIFAFDECTSPLAEKEYQKEAMDRTHRWARRSLSRHVELDPENQQALFAVVQGGRFEDLRKESAETLAKMTLDTGEGFDGFGIGGSFNKEDMGTAVRWVNEKLPEDKPRHLLGIGDPSDLFEGVENGCDLFDCVSPTRLARHGNLYTVDGVINIYNSKFKEDFSPIDPDTPSYTSKNYTRAYLSHLFRSKEMTGATLASIHNLYFIVTLVDKIRQTVIDGTFFEFKTKFLQRYLNKS
ncbi:MAG: queuine tRNA-ribosyltransferase [Candidatus Paceibacteria bacterium]|jgi:queuine tRNA-ribosyltransferase